MTHINKDEPISAFAFITGKKIEKLVTDQVEDIQYRNKILETMLLSWYGRTQDEEFAEYFGITSQRHGKI